MSKVIRWGRGRSNVCITEAPLSATHTPPAASEGPRLQERTGASPGLLPPGSAPFPAAGLLEEHTGYRRTLPTVVYGLWCRGHQQASPSGCRGPQGCCGRGGRAGRHPARWPASPGPAPCPALGPGHTVVRPGLCRSGQRGGCQGDEAVGRGLEPRGLDLPWDVRAPEPAQVGTGVRGRGRAPLYETPRLGGRDASWGRSGRGSWAPEAARRRGGGDGWSTGRSAGTFVGSPSAMRSRVTWGFRAHSRPSDESPRQEPPGARGAGVRPRSDAGAPRPRRLPEPRLESWPGCDSPRGPGRALASVLLAFPRRRPRTVRGVGPARPGGPAARRPPRAPPPRGSADAHAPGAAGGGWGRGPAQAPPPSPPDQSERAVGPVGATRGGRGLRAEATACGGRRGAPAEAAAAAAVVAAAAAGPGTATQRARGRDWPARRRTRHRRPESAAAARGLGAVGAAGAAPSVLSGGGGRRGLASR